MQALVKGLESDHAAANLGDSATIPWDVHATGRATREFGHGAMQCVDGSDETHVAQEPYKAYLANAATNLFEAAERQAQAEGRDTGDLKAVHSRSAGNWRAMGYSLAFKTEFRDWTDYCKSLARSHDVLLDKSKLPYGAVN